MYISSETVKYIRFSDKNSSKAMQQRWIHRLMFIVWLLCSSQAQAVAFTADDSYGASFGNVNNSGMLGGKSVTAHEVEGCPTYNFQTTSRYVSTEYGSSTGMGMQRVRRSSSPWDTSDDEIGVVPDPTPVGEPIALLVMAIGYVILRWRRRRISAARQAPCQL